MPVNPQDPVSLLPNGGWDERVLVARCGTTVDAHIVVTARYVVLVDTLLNLQTAGAMLAFARARLTDGRQLLVVNTHADWDHCWGNSLFAGPGATHPAPIIASRRCAERLRDPEAESTLRKMQAREPNRFRDVRLVPPTVLFNDRLAIDGGDLTLELFPTAGHTPDHISVFIPEIGLLLAGDAAESPFPFAHAAADLPDLRASLARMVALAPAQALYCHAPATSGPALLRHNLAYFDRLEERCRAALARGVPADPPADADVEAVVAFPFADAMPPSVDPAAQGDFYRQGHRAQTRLMLEHLAGD